MVSYIKGHCELDLNNDHQIKFKGCGSYGTEVIELNLSVTGRPTNGARTIS